MVRNWFGRFFVEQYQQKTPSRPTSHSRLTLQTLEDRTTPANLTLNGTPNNDTFVITVGMNGNFFNNNIDTGVVSNASSTITINGGLGNDLIDLSALTTAHYVSSTLTADPTFGSFTPGIDTVLGGAGKDTIRGGPGADVTEGGAGDDVFINSGGDVAFDQISGGLGNDRILNIANNQLTFNNFLSTNGIEIFDENRNENWPVRGTSGSDVINLASIKTFTGTNAAGNPDSGVGKKVEGLVSSDLIVTTPHVSGILYDGGNDQNFGAPNTRPDFTDLDDTIQIALTPTQYSNLLQPTNSTAFAAVMSYIANPIPFNNNNPFVFSFDHDLNSNTANFVLTAQDFENAALAVVDPATGNVFDLPAAYYVFGNEGGNTITITGTPDSLSVTGANSIRIGSPTGPTLPLGPGGTATLIRASALFVDSRGGNDVVDVTGITGFNDDFTGVNINGGNQNDTIYGSAGNDTLFGGANNDVIYGGEGDDLFIVQSPEGPNSTDIMYGEGGNDTFQITETNAGRQDTFDGGEGNDLVEFIGTGNIRLLGASFASIETFDGKGSSIVESNPSETVNLSGIASLQDVPFVLMGNGNDTVTTAEGHTIVTSYEGDSGSGDHINMIFTPTELGALTPAELDALEAYVMAPTGKVLGPTGTSGVTNVVSIAFSAREFESASVLVRIGDDLVDITDDLDTDAGDFTPTADLITFRLQNGGGNKDAKYLGEDEDMDVDNPSNPFTDPGMDGNLISISALGGTANFFGGRLRLGVASSGETGSGPDTIKLGETIIFQLGTDANTTGKKWIGADVFLQGIGTGNVVFLKDGTVVGMQSVTSTDAGGIISLSPAFGLTFDTIQIQGLTGAFGVKGISAGKFYFDTPPMMVSSLRLDSTAETPAQTDLTSDEAHSDNLVSGSAPDTLFFAGDSTDQEEQPTIRPDLETHPLIPHGVSLETPSVLSTQEQQEEITLVPLSNGKTNDLLNLPGVHLDDLDVVNLPI